MAEETYKDVCEMAEIAWAKMLFDGTILSPLICLAGTVQLQVPDHVMVLGYIQSIDDLAKQYMAGRFTKEQCKYFEETVLNNDVYTPFLTALPKPFGPDKNQGH